MATGLSSSTIRAAKAMASRRMSARHQRRAIAKLAEQQRKKGGSK